jgi:small-conductance mechanosensitive channel
MDSALWSSAVSDATRAFVDRAIAYLPSIAAALALVVAGWAAAALLRVVARRVLGALLGWLGKHHGVGRALERSGLGAGFATVASRVTFWLVLLLFVAAAIERLQLPLAAQLVNGLVAFFPRLLVAVAMIFAALLAGQMAHGAVVSTAARATLPQADLLGRTTQVLIVFLGVATAGDHLGVHSTLITVVIATVLGTVLGGATLAFGLGSGPAVSNIIAIFYVLKSYRIGQHVRVGDVQGEIVDITQTGVVVAVPEGRVLIPGRRFSEEASLLLTGGPS